MVATWIYGALINVGGSIAINFGTNMLKMAHNRNDEREKLQKKSKHNLRSRTWLLGFCIFTLGNLANFVSFGFAAQSLLAGLGSVQFITNVVFARYVLGERISRRIIGATLIIVVGNSFVVLFADQSSNVFTGKQLLALYQRRAFILYMLFLLATVVLCQCGYRRIKYARRHPNGECVSRSTKRRLLPVLYAVVSAIIGTQSVILAKSASTLFRSTVGGNNQLVDPFTYVVLVAWVVAMAFWLYRMNAALRKFDGIFIIPILQVAWILFSVLGGGIYFQEFSHMSPQDAVGFSSGIAMVMLGIYLLAPKDTTSMNAVRDLSLSGARALDQSPVLQESIVHSRDEVTDEESSSENLNFHTLSHEPSLLSLFSHDVMFGPFELANDWRTFQQESSGDEAESGDSIRPLSPSSKKMREMNSDIGPKHNEDERCEWDNTVAPVPDQPHSRLDNCAAEGDFESNRHSRRSSNNDSSRKSVGELESVVVDASKKDKIETVKSMPSLSDSRRHEDS